jgi:protein-S-isoprenylcysteine O-methyltransferase Ste14
MRKPAAAVGTALFFAIAPGVVAGVGPYLVTGWQTASSYWLPVRVTGWVLLGAGAIVLVSAFLRFVTEGMGTPAPVAPAEHLVVGGLYRYVRNPMYVAVVATILGQAMVLGSAALFGYGAAIALTVAAFAHFYEEPALTRQFGAEYEVYRRAVPGWYPRLRPRSGHGESLVRPRR